MIPLRGFFYHCFTIFFLLWLLNAGPMCVCCLGLNVSCFCLVSEFKLNCLVDHWDQWTFSIFPLLVVGVCLFVIVVILLFFIFFYYFLFSSLSICARLGYLLGSVLFSHSQFYYSLFSMIIFAFFLVSCSFFPLSLFFFYFLFTVKLNSSPCLLHSMIMMDWIAIGIRERNSRKTMK